MPRRYRPPTRRRKPKKERFYGEAESPSFEGVAAPDPTSPPVAAPAAPAPERPSQTQHITRDYSYVVSDLWRIGFIVAFITAGIIITAILR